MKYNEVIMSLVNSLAKSFDTVYHSAELITVDDKKIPVIPIGDEWLPLDVTDENEVLYIRRSGDDFVSEEKKLSSCSVAYTMRTPLRIVYFRDHAPSHYEIISKLMRASLVSFTKLRSITRDKFKLTKEETSMSPKLGAMTAYIAIDIYVIWHLVPDTCDEDFCITVDNPIKKCVTVDIVNS